MLLATALATLKKQGSAQTRKTYARHGVGENQFGVSYANLKALTKQIKCDQALAEGLWASGNHDARILALMVADPAAFTSALLDRWAREVDNYVIAGEFGKLAAKTKHAQAKAAKWIKSPRELIATIGWSIYCHLAMDDATLGDDDCRALLATIERDIHGAPNRVRYVMNNALIGLGVRNATLTPLALATAARIGHVEIDHGDTSCKTPDAATYIAKTLAHQGRKSKRAGC
jgi:3-methyladenine DNA glycosylase AlkD